MQYSSLDNNFYYWYHLISGPKAILLVSVITSKPHFSYPIKVDSSFCLLPVLMTALFEASRLNAKTISVREYDVYDALLFNKHWRNPELNSFLLPSYNFFPFSKARTRILLFLFTNYSAISHHYFDNTDVDPILFGLCCMWIVDG